MTSGVTAFPPAPSPRMDRPLPAPVVDPLRECQRAIRVSEVLVGARVIVERSSGTTHADSFYYPDLTFNAIAPPLSRGEIVAAWQEFPACQLSSPRSTPVTVEGDELFAVTHGCSTKRSGGGILLIPVG